MKSVTPDLNKLLEYYRIYDKAFLFQCIIYFLSSSCFFLYHCLFRFVVFTTLYCSFHMVYMVCICWWHNFVYQQDHIFPSNRNSTLNAKEGFFSSKISISWGSSSLQWQESITFRFHYYCLDLLFSSDSNLLVSRFIWCILLTT